MERQIQERLKAAGIEAQEAIERFMGKESLYEKFALKFLEDNNYKILMDALEDENVEKSFAAAHTLKGICQNLSFIKLAAAVGQMTEQLRDGHIEQAKALVTKLKDCYEETTQALKEWRG